MNILRKPLHILLSLTFLLMSVVGLSQPAQALDNATLSFSANKTTLNVGEQVTVTVNVTTAGTPGAGSIRLIVNYDASKLSLVSAGDIGSAFQGNSATASAPGQFSTSRYTTTNGGMTGTGKVVDLTFQALVATTTTISFDAGSKIWEYGGDEKTLNKGATQNLTITNVTPPTPPPNPAPTINSFTVAPTKITQGASATLAWDVASASSVSINQGVGNVSAKSQGVVKPSVTTTYTLTATNSGGSVTRSVTLTVVSPTPTPKPNVTPAPTPTPAATATPVPTATADPNTLSLAQSSITFSNTTAVADGVDTITVTVNLLRENGTPASDVEPTISGLRDIGDSASPFVYDESTQVWTSFITSTEIGSTTITISAGGFDLASQELTFTEPASTPEPVNLDDNSGSSFWRLLLIGLGLLILLLLILFFLWRRLRRDDEDEGDYADEEDPNAPAFPGDESVQETAPTEDVAPAPAPAEPPKEEESAGFDANQALQRTPPAAPAEQPQQPNDTIPL